MQMFDIRTSEARSTPAHRRYKCPSYGIELPFGQRSVRDRALIVSNKRETNGSDVTSKKSVQTNSLR